ncbi:cysteine desulfurase [PVC group bacterium]|nr:cysteine desulfurase [PVC group bacterium]
MLTMETNISKIRQDFPALKRLVRGRDLVYLDNAATTLKPQSVIDAITHYYTDLSSNVHRGVHFLSEESTARFEEAREKVSQFISARQSAEIVFTRGTTDAINLVSQSYGKTFIKSGDEILITEMEHHSNIVSWQILCKEKGCVLKVAPITDEGELVMDEFEKLIGPKTKMIALVYVSNVLGTINPVKDIIRLAHERNIPVLIDGAQAVGQFPVDVVDLDCDFFAFSAHKMFGPTGVGVLYAKAEYLNLMPPIQGGGDMILSVSFDKTTYNTIPYKFEAGTPNIAGVIGLGAAVEYINQLGFESIVQHEKDISAYLTQSLGEVEGLKIIGRAKNKVPIASFVLDHVHPHDIGTIIDEEGVAVRTGHHCAQPLMSRYGLPATARASFSLYNTKEEVDILIKAIEKVKAVFK